MPFMLALYFCISAPASLSWRPFQRGSCRPLKGLRLLTCTDHSFPVTEGQNHATAVGVDVHAVVAGMDVHASAAGAELHAIVAGADAHTTAAGTHALLSINATVFPVVSLCVWLCVPQFGNCFAVSSSPVSISCLRPLPPPVSYVRTLADCFFRRAQTSREGSENQWLDHTASKSWMNCNRRSADSKLDTSGP